MFGNLSDLTSEPDMFVALCVNKWLSFLAENRKTKRCWKEIIYGMADLTGTMQKEESIFGQFVESESQPPHPKGTTKNTLVRKTTCLSLNEPDEALQHLLVSGIRQILQVLPAAGLQQQPTGIDASGIAVHLVLPFYQ